MFADDALDDHEAKSRPLRLRGVERLEDAVDLFRRNAAARIGHADPHAFVGLAGGHRQHAVLAHGLHRVLHQVHQCLLDLRHIQGRRGQLARAFVLHGDSPVLHLRAQKVQGVDDDVVERLGMEIGFCRPDGLEELRDDVVEPRDLALGDVEVAVDLVEDLRGFGG